MKVTFFSCHWFSDKNLVEKPLGTYTKIVSQYWTNRGGISLMIIIVVCFAGVAGLVGYYWNVAHTGGLYCGGFIPSGCPIGNVCRRENPSSSTGKCFPASLFATKTKNVSSPSSEEKPQPPNQNSTLKSYKPYIIADLELKVPSTWTQSDKDEHKIGPLTLGFDAKLTDRSNLFQSIQNKAVYMNPAYVNLKPTLVRSEPDFINKFLVIKQIYSLSSNTKYDPYNPKGVFLTVILGKDAFYWIRSEENTEEVKQVMASIEKGSYAPNNVNFLIEYHGPIYQLSFPALFSFSASTDFQYESISVGSMVVDINNSQITYGRPYGSTFYATQQSNKNSKAVDISKLETIGIGNSINISSSEIYPITYTRVANTKVSGLTTAVKKFKNEKPLEMPGVREELILAEYNQKRFKIGGFYQDATEEKAYREILSSLEFASEK